MHLLAGGWEIKWVGEGEPRRVRAKDLERIINEMVGLCENSREVIHPKNGRWPHMTNVRWTIEEREALFEMMHRLNAPMSFLEEVTGCHRQVIVNAVGSRIAPKTGEWPEMMKWRPSKDLLLKCNLPVRDS